MSHQKLGCLIGCLDWLYMITTQYISKLIQSSKIPKSQCLFDRLVEAPCFECTDFSYSKSHFGLPGGWLSKENDQISLIHTIFSYYIRYYFHMMSIFSTFCPYMSYIWLFQWNPPGFLPTGQVAGPHGIGQGPGRLRFAHRDALAAPLLLGRLAAEGEGFHETYGGWRGSWVFTGNWWILRWRSPWYPHNIS